MARFGGIDAVARTLAADDAHVRFGYTDTATQQRKECTLTADEFMRRHLQHVAARGGIACATLAGCIRPPKRVA